MDNPLGVRGGQGRGRLVDDVDGGGHLDAPDAVQAIGQSSPLRYSITRNGSPDGTVPKSDT